MESKSLDNIVLPCHQLQSLAYSGALGPGGERDERRRTRRDTGAAWGSYLDAAVEVGLSVLDSTQGHLAHVQTLDGCCKLLGHLRPERSFLGKPFVLGCSHTRRSARSAPWRQCRLCTISMLRRACIFLFLRVVQR